MKWKQPKVSFAMLALLTAATLALTYKHNIGYQRYVQETTREYEDLGIDPSLLDLWPWHAWGIGGFVTFLVVMTIALWMASVVIWLEGRRNLRCKKPLILVFLLIPVLFLTPVNIAVATPTLDTDVDILFVGDEEFMDGWIPGFIWGQKIPLTTLVEEGFWIIPGIFPTVKDRFNGQLGINLVFHGWATWDSYDGTNDAWDMLQEAIKEAGQGYWVVNSSYPDGGYWKFNRGMTWNGILIDILVAWTHQDMDMRGFAPFDWGGLIIKYVDWDRDDEVLQHELSHLYDARHCSHAWCVMNPDWLYHDWQSTCKDHMLAYKDYFTREVLTLTIAVGSGGYTSPAPGIYEYDKGTSVTVTALPRPGFTFKYWVLDGTTKYGNPITVTMNSDHGLKAYFKEKYCPILFVWNGTDYDEEGLLNIHNPDGIDLVYNHTLITEPAWTKGKYQLRLVEHQKTHSYIDQVKLYAVLENGTRIKMPLIYAWHSEHGNVLPQLLFSDEWKTDTLGAELNNGTSQSIDLKFASPPDLQAVSFIFQIEGNNKLPK